MDHPPRSSSDIESRDRIGSSDPCSTRPNPFDDDDGSSARKRRRTSINGASSSRSIDTPSASCSPPVVTETDPATVDNDHGEDITMTIDAVSPEPQTPQQQELDLPPISDSKPKRVTLNLKSKNQTTQSLSSSPISQNDLDQDFVEPQENGIRLSVEDDEFDDAQGPGDFADTDNLPIEIIDDDDEDESDDGQDAGVTVLNGPDLNPMISFPYQPSEPLVDSLPRLCHLLQSNIQALIAFRTWMEHYVVWAGRVGSLEQYTLYKDYCDFWQALPQLFYVHTGPYKNRSAQAQQALFELHMAYAQLTAVFVDMDASEMTSGVSEQGWQEPASTPFLAHLVWLLQDYGRPVASSLAVMDPDTIWPEPVARLVDEFRATRRTPNSPPLTRSLYILGHGLAEMLPSHPRFVECLNPVVQQISFLVRDEVARLQSAPYLQSPDRAKSTLALTQGYRLFKAVADAFHICIDKHVNQITPYTAEHLIPGLANILRLALRAGCEPTADLIRSHQQDYPAVQQEDTVKIIVAEWRLEILTKLLMSSQMQLRIVAAPTMCSDLVEIWSEFRDLPQPPVLSHFSSKLVQSGVIDYILGPTCHPEVTAQSFNIIGFLFASHTITQEHLDLMWRTATTCQISGVSDSLLGMVGSITNLFHMPEFLSLCGKLQSVPIENFTPQLKDFCDKVITSLVQKNNNIQDLLPYSLMFRLLRESSVPGPPSYREIQKWASDLIPQLLRRGPLPQDRHLLQQECLQDIIEKTRYTLGSIHALGLLYRPVSRDRDMQQLILQHDLPRLLVDELENAIASREDLGVQNAISGPENAPRLHLLGHVVLGAERNVLTDELGRKLWQLLVGQGAASEEDRDCAWLSLNKVMASDPGHPFLKTCFKEYFPTLPPELFRPGTLEFVLHKVVPLLNKTDTFVLEDAETSDHVAIEQLWRAALIAPGGTIEQQAIGALVKDVYLENTAIRHMPLHRARNIHLALVSRCMQQLSSAAEQCSADMENIERDGSDPMVITVDAHQKSDQEQLFTRSLTIVTEFHKLHQQIPRFSSPDLRSLGLEETKVMEGASAELKVQSFDGQTQTDVKPLPIGRLNTAGSLLASIRSVTGFDNYRLYYKGQPFTPSEQDICRSLEDLHIHDGLILVKREMDSVKPPAHVRPGASPVEIEIMRHFDELWQFLALKETLAGKIYDFLVTLPVDEHVLSLLTQATTTYRDVFPPGQPLKSLYALYAIQKYLVQLSSLNSPSKGNGAYCDALRRILKLVIAAISDREVIDNGSGVFLKAKLASRLVKQFAEILTDPLRAPSTAEDLDKTLGERLGELLDSALVMGRSPPITDLVIETFKAILETCVLKAELWELLHSQTRFRDIVQKLLIDDDREVVRKSTASHIENVIVANTLAVSAAALTGFFWPLLMDLFPHALSMRAHSLECFYLAASVLVSAKTSQSLGLDLTEAVGRIFGMLESYHVCEVPALALALSAPAENSTSMILCQPGTDRGAFGLVTLLERLLCNKADQEVLATLPSGAGWRILAHLLFPDGRSFTVPDLLWPQGLVFNEPTRHRLNNIVLALAGRDLEQITEIFTGFHGMLPCANNDRSEFEPTYLWEVSFDFDRGKEIRAACGYAGLKNLSNTCYLNSLCTQLFMNVEFRRFMLSIDVDRRDASRALLLETQNMFGRLQGSQHRFVDPELFVASIKTYDDDLINVNNQMDVEEFFNLLNDRWEGQLRSPEAVRRFRAFYGGQLVTQTKSKECDHISEVLEPFSAIQCDIKGKKNLFESLEAYVNGEHMEGDNKYKCSSCDRHVDAVRRTCLKEIPDSLIFHLKRFDFNLRAQSRSKINDYFAFPTRINMRPYTVEHISNSPEGFTEDVFVLVGVLVHAGTAESGHYYSYIRERPSSRPDGNWCEFNDDNVSSWNPSNLEACCFGGPESTWDTAGVRYEKNHSAYMLFYERASALERRQLEVQELNMSCPVQVPVPNHLEHAIKTQNLFLLRRHCLFDPDHLRFFNSAIDRLLEMNGGECSELHEIEKLAIEAAIAHLDQVASRTKGAQGARALANSIMRMVQTCPQCAFVAFEYLSSHHEAFRNLVLRCPEVEVRRCAADIFIECLESIKDNLSNEYYVSSSSDPASDAVPNDVVCGACDMFDYLCYLIPHAVNFHRSWPEVFRMMARFVELGQAETLIFVNHYMLEKILMIFVAPYLADDERDQQFTKFANYVIRRPNRQPNYASVIGLLRSILTQFSITKPVQSPLQREQMVYNESDAPFRLTESEFRLLRTLGDGVNALIDKLICTNQNVEATDAIVAHILKEKGPMDKDVFDTLRTNLVPQQSYMIYGPYLRVAEQYCRSSHYAVRINQLIAHVAEHSQCFALNEGKALWSFFQASMDGQRLHSGESKISIAAQSLQHLPTWAPVLLHHFDGDLSAEVESLLDEKIFSFGPESTFEEEQGGEEMSKKIAECARCIGLQCCEYVRDVYIRRNQSVPSSTYDSLSRVLDEVGPYFNEEEAEGQAFLQNVNVVLDNVRRLIVADDLEDDGSDWENSAGSSDQADSVGDDDMKDFEF
ncbi:unnamed protein product [Discula destructiva]